MPDVDQEIWVLEGLSLVTSVGDADKLAVVHGSLAICDSRGVHAGTA